MEKHRLYPFRIVLLGIAVFGVILGFVPSLMGIYDIGCQFIQAISLGVAFFAIFYKKINGKVVSKFMTGLLICFCIGIVYSGFCLFQILSAQFNVSIPENATVIVLGSQTREDGPSLSFRTRLDAAYDYLIENEEAVCIVAGGQGSNEPMPEGQAGKDYLTEKGIDESRVFAEIKSVDTIQNLEFSLDIIEENKLNKNVVISTQGFHQYRATLQAKGFEFESVSSIIADTPKLLIPAYYGREILAVTKQYLYTLLRLR